MPYTVRDLPSLIATSSGSLVTAAIGHLDDASSITLFFPSSASAQTSNATIQVSQFDPADKFPQSGVTQSSNFYVASASSSLTFSSSGGAGGGVALVMSNISFRGLRIGGMTSSTATVGEIIAYASKQITV
jgi:hypothetical protein